MSQIVCTKCKSKGNFSIHGRCLKCDTIAPTKYNTSPVLSEGKGNRGRARTSRAAGNTGGAVSKGKKIR